MLRPILANLWIRIHISSVLLILFSSCADMEGTKEFDASTVSKIINGYEENGELATVALVLNDFGPFCTGTLIAPKIVLTAAHCISTMSQDALNIIPMLPDEVQVIQGTTKHESARVAGAIFHPDWNHDNLSHGVDIGLVYLKSPLSPAPIPLDETPHDQRLWQEGKIVGFGMTEGLNLNSIGRKCLLLLWPLKSLMML